MQPVFYVAMWLFIFAAGVTFVVRFLTSPGMVLTDAEFDKSIKVGGDEQGLGGYWTSRGIHEMGWWWHENIAGGLVFAVFILLCYLGATHRG